MSCNSIDCAYVDTVTCEADGTGCTADALADELSPSTCDGTDGYVSAICGYTDDGDSN